MATAPLPDASIVHVQAGQSWTPVLQPQTGLLVERGSAPLADSVVGVALKVLDTLLHIAGPSVDLPNALAMLPLPLAADILRLASSFAALMRVPDIRLRLERIETDACRKWHLDYTDLRLVATYGGPGTQFRLSEANPIEQVATGAIALFKGRRFGPGHCLIEHRSPPIAGTGVRRLVLVIDTPAKAFDAASAVEGGAP